MCFSLYCITTLFSLMGEPVRAWSYGRELFLPRMRDQISENHTAYLGSWGLWCQPPVSYSRPSHFPGSSQYRLFKMLVWKCYHTAVNHLMTCHCSQDGYNSQRKSHLGPCAPSSFFLNFSLFLSQSSLPQDFCTHCSLCSSCPSIPSLAC